VHFLWSDLRAAWPLILHGDPTLVSIIVFTLEVAGLAAGVGTVIGVPLGVTIGLSRSRTRAFWHGLASLSLALPPALVGAVLVLLFAGHGPLASWHLEYTRRAVFIAQIILALPYTVALTAAAVRALPAGLPAQARQLGAGRSQLAILAIREARIGIVAAIVAALGSSLAEVAAVSLVGGNEYGYDQTLSSSTLFDVANAYYAPATAVGIVLAAMILVLLGAVAALQHRGHGTLWRFRTAS
jgi:tungstate transport system permease protein